MRPLDGVLVLELGEGISAAYCTQILGDLGADVIKIEPPSGDITRRLGPFPQDTPDREKSGLFLYLNRNKQSLALDISCATGQEIVRTLAKAANLVVENFEPGTLDRFGLSYDELAILNPGLVMTSITPFGQSGPYSHFKASEIVLFAMGGLMTFIGDKKREPLKMGGSPMLYMGGLFGFASTMTALHLAEATNLGQHVDVSIMEGITASHAQDTLDYEYLGTVRTRGDLRTPIPCTDGFVSFAVQAHQYADFQRLILGDEQTDADDVIERDRRRREGEMDLDILLWAAERSKVDAYREAQQGHVPAAFMADARDVLNSPQLQSRGYFHEISHPKAGTLSYAGLPARMTHADLAYGPAPLLGQHTELLLKKYLQYSDGEIDELKAVGVI